MFLKNKKDDIFIRNKAKRLRRNKMSILEHVRKIIMLSRSMEWNLNSNEFQWFEMMVDEYGIEENPADITYDELLNYISDKSTRWEGC